MAKFPLALAIVLVILIGISSPSYAQVDGGIVKFGSSVTVPRGETETGSVVVFGGDAIINGGIEDDLVMFGGDLALNGVVGNNLVIFGGDIALGEEALVQGDFVHFGGTVNRSAGARVIGDEVAAGRTFIPLFSIFFWFVNLVFILILSVVMVAILPEQTAVLAKTVDKQFLSSFGIGLLGTILIPFIFVVLALIIVVGWIFIPFVALSIPIVYLYGFVGVSRWLGERLIRATRLVNNTPMSQVIIGALLLSVIGFIPIFGWLVIVVALFTGLGAVVLSNFGTGKPWFGRGPSERVPPPGAEPGSKGAA